MHHKPQRAVNDDADGVGTNRARDAARRPSAVCPSRLALELGVQCRDRLERR